jgi:alpha-beta hydrolase superfamily lysophospholipase
MAMRPAFHIEIITPKKVILDGLWLGPRKPKRVVIWMHGLGSSMFRKLAIMDHLLDGRTAVLTFNNRGHDKVTRAWTLNGRTLKAGAAHEVFTECVDDIEGAIRFARSHGVKKIFLAGHSTGCQKCAYWASKRAKGVKGIILLSPISDRASEVSISGKAKLARVEKIAREFVRKGKPHELLPENVWGWRWIADAQRFLSLYSGNSSEELFTYWDPKRNAKALRSIKIPMLVLFGADEEYTDRPIKEIAVWFQRNLKPVDRVILLPKTGHSFRGAEKTVAKAIRVFMQRS